MSADGVEVPFEGCSPQWGDSDLLPRWMHARLHGFFSLQLRQHVLRVDDGSCLQLDACGVCGGQLVWTQMATAFATLLKLLDVRTKMLATTWPATTDPVPATGLSIVLTAGTWPSEISWTLNGETYGAPFSGFIALDAGSYLIEGFDSYADGWNGAEMTIVEGDNIYTFSVAGSYDSIEIDVTASDLTCSYPSQDYLDCNERMHQRRRWRRCV